MCIENVVYRALRISNSGKINFFAVLASDIQPLPHQIDAVYDKMLTQPQLHFLLADDPGSGKTIMTGLFLKELFIRKALTRFLIVSPGSIAEQWQEELDSKFHMAFSLLEDNKPIPPLCIARLDTLARNESLMLKTSSQIWDAVIIDEAHKMSAQVFNNETHYTKRFHVGQALAKNAANLILLTATPHNGKSQDFTQFISLLGSNYSMRRLLKENLITFSGKELFPKRQAYTVSYRLSELEARLYEKVTSYVRSEFNRAERLSTKRKNSVGFAMTILQRRLASSPEAIAQSLSETH